MTLGGDFETVEPFGGICELFGQVIVVVLCLIIRIVFLCTPDELTLDGQRIPAGYAANVDRVEHLGHVTDRDPELSRAQLGLNWIVVKLVLHEWGPELALRAVSAFVGNNVPLIDAL